MARPLRIEYPGAYYHITSRGNERKNIFRSNKDRGQFLSYLKSAYFGIGDSAVSEASKQFIINLEKNKKLKSKITSIRKQLNI